MDKNDRIAFIEYLLLHFKKMILLAYYKRTGENNPHDLSNEGIGVTGVGDQLLDELFTLPVGLDPALEKAIEEFTAQKKAREKKMEELAKLSQESGVKGLRAKNELAQMQSEDLTEMNKMELTLNAARKKAAKNSGEQALQEKKKREEEEKKAKIAEGRARLAKIASNFQ